jgi:hypothetical protein
MRPRPRRRAFRLAVAPVGLLVHLVLTATPAAAHGAAGGSLPAPPWLLAYIGAFAVALTALALRMSWPAPRFARTRPDPEPAADADPRPERGLQVGQVAGLVVYLGVAAIALFGPTERGINIAPYAVFVIWWVGLPFLCLLLGDVVRAVNPFLALLDLVERVRGERPPVADDRAAPSWTAAAFLAAFTWFPLAYHRADSGRMTGILLVLYALAALVGGLVWGRAWLETGEGFGGLSRAVSQISLRRRRPAAPGMLALAVVWIGGTLFDAVSSTTFWVDVLGTTTGWSRTALNTVGDVWMLAVVAVVVQAVLRYAGDRVEDADVVRRVLGLALVPVALTWFLAHDLTYFLFESQNFRALASDPLGRGWDLFGTYNDTIDYSIVTGRWVRWAQIVALLVAHLGAVVLAHDAALAGLGRRRGMRVTWAVSAGLALSAVAAALMVLE